MNELTEFLHHESSHPVEKTMQQKRDEFVREALIGFYEANPDYCLQIALKQDEILNPKSTAVYYPKSSVDMVRGYERMNAIAKKSKRTAKNTKLMLMPWAWIALFISSLAYEIYLINAYPDATPPTILLTLFVICIVTMGIGLVMAIKSFFDLYE